MFLFCIVLTLVQGWGQAVHDSLLVYHVDDIFQTDGEGRSQLYIGISFVKLEAWTGVGYGDWWLYTSNTGVEHLGERSLLFFLFFFFFNSFLQIRTLERFVLSTYSSPFVF